MAFHQEDHVHELLGVGQEHIIMGKPFEQDQEYIMRKPVEQDQEHMIMGQPLVQEQEHMIMGQPLEQEQEHMFMGQPLEQAQEHMLMGQPLEQDVVDDYEQQFGITVGSIAGLSPLGTKIPVQILPNQAKMKPVGLPVLIETSGVALLAPECLGKLESKEIPSQILQSPGKIGLPVVLQNPVEIPGVLDTSAATIQWKGGVPKLKYEAAPIGLNIDGTLPAFMAEAAKAKREEKTRSGDNTDNKASKVTTHMQQPYPLNIGTIQGAANPEGSAMQPMVALATNGKEPARKISYHRSPVCTKENLKIFPLVLRTPKVVQPSGLLYSSAKNRAECVLPRTRIQGLPGLRLPQSQVLHG